MAPTTTDRAHFCCSSLLEDEPAKFWIPFYLPTCLEYWPILPDRRRNAANDFTLPYKMTHETIEAPPGVGGWGGVLD